MRAAGLGWSKNTLSWLPDSSAMAIGYGMRQNMDYDNPVFRRYAERVITNLVSHSCDNPDVIAWQIDNS